MLPCTYYQVDWEDPNPDTTTFNGLAEAIVFIQRCYGFKKLRKLEEYDLTSLLPDFETLLPPAIQ